MNIGAEEHQKIRRYSSKWKGRLKHGRLEQFVEPGEEAPTLGHPN